MYMRKMRTSWLLVAACVVGCGSVTGDKPDARPMGDATAGDFSLSVDPTAANVPIASSVDVTVTVARTGTSGDITLTAIATSTDSSPASAQVHLTGAALTGRDITLTAMATSTVDTGATAGLALGD